jgi:hypothetical protein
LGAALDGAVKVTELRRIAFRLGDFRGDARRVKAQPPKRFLFDLPYAFSRHVEESARLLPLCSDSLSAEKAHAMAFVNGPPDVTNTRPEILAKSLLSSATRVSA